MAVVRQKLRRCKEKKGRKKSKGRGRGKSSRLKNLFAGSMPSGGFLLLQGATKIVGDLLYDGNKRPPSYWFKQDVSEV